MRNLLLAFLLLPACAWAGAPVQITVDAPAYAGQQATLYRYADAFTLRLEPLATGRVDDAGSVRLTAEVEGTRKALLLIGLVGADLWLRPGAYHVAMPAPGPGQVLNVGGSARVALTFLDLDPLDVNALVSDLNGRLDAFLAEGLATDQDAGMEAVAKARSGAAALERDTARTAQGLFISPTWDESRVDSFGQKLRKFYAAVDDPWFQSDVEYGLAGLRLGPRSNDRALYNRFLAGKPVLYNVPEYTRFFSNFYDDFVMGLPFRSHTDALLRYIREARTDSLKALLGRNDLLADDRINELVLITNLYANHANALFDAAGIRKVLADVQANSRFPEHRAIAGNMLWDLGAMEPGSDLPRVQLLDAAGAPLPWDSLWRGTTCLLVTMAGNPYCEQELIALKQLGAEYSGYVNVLHVVLGKDPAELAQWQANGPARPGTWAVPADQRQLLDRWRIKSIPAFFLLNGQSLAGQPGLQPSRGLAAELFRLKTAADRERKISPGAQPPPRR